MCGTKTDERKSRTFFEHVLVLLLLLLLELSSEVKKSSPNGPNKLKKVTFENLAFRLGELFVFGKKWVFVSMISSNSVGA